MAPSPQRGRRVTVPTSITGAETEQARFHGLTDDNKEAVVVIGNRAYVVPAKYVKFKEKS